MSMSLSGLEGRPQLRRGLEASLALWPVLPAVDLNDDSHGSGE